MPTYPYRCLDCQKRFETFLTYAEYGQIQPACPHCGSSHVTRRIGRVRVARSEESHLERYAGSGAFSDLENDPRELGRMMRQMSGEMGEDLGPEFGEVVDRLEAGQNPEEIEQALPNLGDETSGDLDF